MPALLAESDTNADADADADADAVTSFCPIPVRPSCAQPASPGIV